jgi:hypothetical protein
MDKVQKYNSFNTNTPSSESYRNYQLRMSENIVFRRIYGPMNEEIVEGWRKVHIEEVRNLYVSLNIMVWRMYT